MLSEKTSIILINGPSSSGKTTLAKLLQANLKQNYLYIGFDAMVSMMPSKANGWDGKEILDGFWSYRTYEPCGTMVAYLKRGEYAKQLIQSYKKAAFVFANNGHNLVIDDICIFEGDFQNWQTLLKPFNVLYIGLDAPLETLEIREKQRPDRFQGSARAQRKTIHNHAKYDLWLDTKELSPKECVMKIMSCLLG